MVSIITLCIIILCSHETTVEYAVRRWPKRRYAAHTRVSTRIFAIQGAKFWLLERVLEDERSCIDGCEVFPNTFAVIPIILKAISVN